MSTRHIIRTLASARSRFATHLLHACDAIRTVHALLGHADLSITMIYTHVLKVGGGAVRSPLDSVVPTRGDQVAREAGVD